MDQFFIQNIFLKNVRYLDNFNIPLGEEERKHLILTGKNGSGKTTTLLEINTLLMKLYQNQFQNLQNAHTNIRVFTDTLRLEKEQYEKITININSLEKILAEIETTDPINRERTQEQTIPKITQYKNDKTESLRRISTYETQIINAQDQIQNFSNVDVIFKNQENLYQHALNGTFIMAYFEAQRHNKPKIPQGAQKINLLPQKSTDTKVLHNEFIQYIVNLRMEKLDAKDENELEEVEKIDQWFNNFENSLKLLFNESNLILKYDRKAFNFNIEYNNKSFSLNQLSDGYSAVISILTELILRMEANKANVYDLQGVVLIDEIETHLHVELQKKILPFFTKFFPNIQFIVTTHSPFVISSLPNAIICDLEKKTIVEDLTAYSYESLVDSYFDTDKYSSNIKEKITQYQKLLEIEKDNLTNENKNELLQFNIFFDSIPTYQNEELKLTIFRMNEQYRTKFSE